MAVWKNDGELFDMMKEVLYTAVVGDIMDEMGYIHQFLPPEIRPLDPAFVLAGRAMPVLEADVTKELKGHNPVLSGKFGLMLEALDSLKENDVYICSGSSRSYALVGEIMAARAHQLKSAGAVVNGYIRDTNGILKLDYPVFSCGSYAQDQAPRGKVIDYNVPVLFGDVTVSPGDIIFGDIDGVVVIPKEIESKVTERAYQKAVGEKLVLKEIMAGKTAAAAFEEFGIM